MAIYPAHVLTQISASRDAGTLIDAWFGGL